MVFDEEHIVFLRYMGISHLFPCNRYSNEGAGEAILVLYHVSCFYIRFHLWFYYGLHMYIYMCCFICCYMVYMSLGVSPGIHRATEQMRSSHIYIYIYIYTHGKQGGVVPFVSL